MKFNKNLIKTLVLVCTITIPGATYAKTSAISESMPITNEKDVDLLSTAGTTRNYEEQVLVLVNKERTSRGLKPLQMDRKVQEVARIKSQDMRKKSYFNHVSPTYGTPFEMLKSFGISYTMAGENIAEGYASPELVVKGWMNSKGHRENILNSEFTHIGVGYEPNGHYWTQMFIR